MNRRTSEERSMNSALSRIGIASAAGLIALLVLATPSAPSATAQRGVDIPNGRVLAETIASAPDGSGRDVRLTAEETVAGPMLRFRSLGKTPAELDAISVDLEQTRARLLQMMDAAGTIRGALAQPELDDTDVVRSRALIEGLTLEELSVIKRTLDPLLNWEATIDELQALADEISAPGGTVLVVPPVHSEIDAAVEGAVPDFVPQATVPAPSFPTPFPGNRSFEPTQDQMMTGFPPGYPVRACIAAPMERYTSARIILMASLQIVDALAPTVELLCNLNIDVLGFGAKIGCIPQAVFVGVREVLALVLEVLDMCAGLVNSAEIEAAYQNTGRIMARLNDHNEDMLTRFQRNQIFLQDLEGNIAREAMDLNLASAVDDPMALFVLPPTTCRDLQGPANDDYFNPPDGSSSGRRQQCGLINEIDRVIDEMRAMVAESGLSTNNADAEIAAAKLHKAAGQNKSAYARYRKAFRELAGTHSGPIE